MVDDVSLSAVATPPPVLELSGLSVRYGTGGRAVDAVRGIDLVVREGESVAIVGESGSGKSTLVQAAIGLLPDGARRRGRILFAGRDLSALSEPQWRAVRGAGMALVPQDPGVALNPTRRVGLQIADALVAHRVLAPGPARARAVELLAEVGLDRPEVRADQYPHELSGGMRQRVLIAIALSCDPRLIIADEPTSALDATVQRRVLDLFAGLTSERGAAVVLVTHDLAVAAERADRIVVVERGVVVEEGPTARLLDAPVHPYTRELLRASRALHGRDVRGTAGAPGRSLVSARGIAKSFAVRGADGSHDRIDAVLPTDLVLREGRTLGLVGESGSGKSTLSRILARLAVPDSGSVLLDDVDIVPFRGRRLRALRRDVQIVHQNPYSSLDPLYSVRSIIEEPMRAAGMPRPRRRARAEALARDVRLDGSLLDRRPRALSGGQRQRVAIARALATRPRLVVLDEPVSALDVSVQETVLELLDELQRRHGLTYLFVTHDLAVVRRIADEVAVMRRGAIVESGPTAQIFSDPRHPYTRELLGAIPIA